VIRALGRAAAIHRPAVRCAAAIARRRSRRVRTSSATIAAMRSDPARTLLAARTPRGAAARACAGRRDAGRDVTTKAIKTT